MWLDKYASNWDIRELIRFSEEKSGSHIWKMAWVGHSLVQQHHFWEIRNGQTARIWEDTCQQLPHWKDWGFTVRFRLNVVTKES